jgi:hypothetical protein
MTALTCEQVRELLPLGLAGYRAAGVTQHLATCPKCRADGELIARLRRATPAAPAGLDARVLGAIRARPVRRPWPNPRQLALAATLAAAVIGGTLLVRVLDQGSSPPAAAGSAGSGGQPLVPLPVLEDPALNGGSVLSNLTEAELESLLTRIES